MLCNNLPAVKNKGSYKSQVGTQIYNEILNGIFSNSIV